MLRGKNIVLGVCGSIAAYKAAFLVRLLVKEGANVQVLMTEGALQFISPLTLATLSRRPVLSDFVRDEAGTWNNHVRLGMDADLVLIAPATANTIAKMASGLCDNLLLAVYLSARVPVALAPAMDEDMFLHPATTENLAKLSSRGHHIIAPGRGDLASGLEGEGRMAEPEAIVSWMNGFFGKRGKRSGPLSKKKVLVTAGPTQEAIDPVRFIGNHSSGKMGYAIAETMAGLGASVTLISGPTALRTEHPGVRTISVSSAAEMYDAAVKAFRQTDIAVLAAAVADFTPAKPSPQKIKKNGNILHLDLKPTRDILGELGRIKRDRQLLAGFALETSNGESNARKKLRSKNLDFIVLNTLNADHRPFGGDDNRITIIDRDNNVQAFGVKDKKQAAVDIVSKILEMTGRAHA